VITGDAVGVELPGAVERERVKPEWHPIKDGCGRLRIGLDLDQVGHLALCGSWLGRGFQRCQTVVCTGHARDGAVGLLRRGVPLGGREIGVWRDVASYGRLPPRLSAPRRTPSPAERLPDFETAAIRAPRRQRLPEAPPPVPTRKRNRTDFGTYFRIRKTGEHMKIQPEVAVVGSLAALAERHLLRSRARGPPVGVKVTLTFSFALPVLFSLRFFLALALINSFTVPAAATARLAVVLQPLRGRCLTTPLPRSESVPGPGTVTGRVAVPFLRFFLTLPKLN
jgi:hypothetical protein